MVQYYSDGVRSYNIFVTTYAHIDSHEYIFCLYLYVCMRSISCSGILDVIHTPRHDIITVSSL